MVLALLLLAAALGCRRRQEVSVGGAAPVTACPPDGFIEDAEDGDGQILTRQGRGGYLYTYVDPNGSTVTPPVGGSFAPEAGGANGSKYALRFAGKLSPSGDVYAGFGMNLRDPKQPYDASPYEGITFLAKAGPGAAKKVRFKIPDHNTDPEGKVCSDCYNDFGVDLELKNEWTRYAVPFGALEQAEGWGMPRPKSLDRASIYGLQWQSEAPATAFDVWIDEVTFTCH